MLADTPRTELAQAVEAERRLASRASATYPVTVYDRRGYVLARGKTVDISQVGVFVVAIPTRRATHYDLVLVEITVPKMGGRSAGHSSRRVVKYYARVIRRDSLGQMVGLGLQFVRKADAD